MAVDDIETRIALLEQGEELTALRLRSDLEGYARGQIDERYRSLSNDINETRTELRSEIAVLRKTVHGANGDNGLRSDVRWLRWALRIQWVAIVVLVASVTGVRLPPMIP